MQAQSSLGEWGHEGQNGQTDPMGTQQGTTLGSLTHSPQTTGWHLLPQHAQGNSVPAVHGPSEAASTVSGEQCPPEVQEQLPVCSHMLHLLPPSLPCAPVSQTRIPQRWLLRALEPSLANLLHPLSLEMGLSPWSLVASCSGESPHRLH